MIFTSEKDDGGNNVGEVGDKLAIEVCEPKERTDSLDRGRGVPVLDGGKFGWIHAYIALPNDHAEIFHGGGIEGTFRDFEREAMFLKAGKDTASAMVV